jgi:hypothetical protein
MPKSWKDFEERVRTLATHIWGINCAPGRVGGVNIDGVIRLDSEITYLVEMTEEKTLGKVREDVTKLVTAKAAAYTKGILARCFCIVNGAVTQGMAEAGEPHHIKVLSIEDFSRMFFDFERYQGARSRSPFGSAINPITGEQDATEYVPVHYLVEGRKEEVSTLEIADFLRQGKRVVLLGEYGSGKSRCLWEAFRTLTPSAHENFCYPIGIDLRKAWGLIRGVEILRRHFADLGLDNLQSSAVRAFNAGSLAILLDGFDEIGSQAWSNDVQKLKSIRAKALEGVKDLVRANRGGVLITGREHYFPSHSEMFSALGLSENDTIVLRSKSEFSDSELAEYFHNRDIEVDVPEWLPRRPLICQTISDLADEDFEGMFSSDGGEVAFWNHFIHVLCERDAKIHVTFDTDTIFRLFVHLARLTRSKSANVGPISLTELQSAFESAVGRMPVEEASVMLQRLPSLGRVGNDSNDRQFIDIYILDGLRAKDVLELIELDEGTISEVAASTWTNPLGDLGQRVLRHDSRVGQNRMMEIAKQALDSKNKILGSDIIASLLRENGDAVDFRGLVVEQGNFLRFDLRDRKISNLTVKDSYFGALVFPSPGSSNLKIINCVAPRVYGVTSVAGLPGWVRELVAEEYDSVESVSRIKRIGLSPAHEILTTIIRKTFFQKGKGRKEEALLRGLGRFGSQGLTNKILNILLRERILEKFKGNEGWVYAPVRANAARMKTLLNELRNSNDPLWKELERL